MKQLRVAITGGFTGGHLFPGLAVAEAIHRRHRRAHVVFMGNADGIEARILPHHPYPLELLPSVRRTCTGFKAACEVPRLLWRLARAVSQAKRVLIAHDVSVVVGTGGHSSAPAMIAAHWLGLPSILLESNALPGRVNRLLARWASEIHTQYACASPYFHGSAPVHVSGNPIRHALLAADIPRYQARPPSRPMKRHTGTTLLVLGGSQGARGLNDALFSALPHVACRVRDLRVIHLTGARDTARARRALADAGVRGKAMDFCEDMGSLYAAADLVLCRSGATTIAELTALGRPSILVPYPYAADDHQTVNARELEQAGAALTLPQSELRAKLASAVSLLLTDTPRRRAMAAAALRLGRPDAAERVAAHVAELAGCTAAAPQEEHHALRPDEPRLAA